MFAVDRFDLVMNNLLFDAELAKAQPPWNVRGPGAGRPRWARASPTTPSSRRSRFSSRSPASTCRRQPRFFVPYEQVAGEAAKKAKPMDELRKLNPGAQATIDRIVARSGRSEADLAFLPAAAPQRDFAVIVERPSGTIVERVLLKPWT